MIAPTEPPELRAAGKVSLKTEERGADILILPHHSLGGGWIGVQRKTVADLVASVPDGRLGQQVSQMASSCLLGFVVLEGRIMWTEDGSMVDSWSRGVTKQGFDHLMFTVQAAGIHVAHTANLKRTIEWCQDLEMWAKKPGHTGLTGRGGPAANSWGVRGVRDWERHLLQGFQGVGPEVANRIIDHFDGAPLAWTCSKEDLMSVKGVGKIRAERLTKALREKDAT